MSIIYSHAYLFERLFTLTSIYFNVYILSRLCLMIICSQLHYSERLYPLMSNCLNNYILPLLMFWTIICSHGYIFLNDPILSRLHNKFLNVYVLSRLLLWAIMCSHVQLCERLYTSTSSFWTIMYSRVYYFERLYALTSTLLSNYVLSCLFFYFILFFLNE